MKNASWGLTLILLLFNQVAGHSCINMFHSVDKEGKVHQIGTEGFIGFNQNFNAQLINRKLQPLYEKIETTGSPKHLSDYAVLLLKAGKVKEALHIFQELQPNYPEAYELAANLGTTYELVGELDSALKYIKLGMELNADAHEGSEWVHVAVLKTKKELEKNPDFLKNHTVLSLSEDDKHDPNTRDQLEVQVRERFPFSPGPNAIMASLMVDLGDCYANTQSYELAKAFYSIAEYYYGANAAVTQPKIEEMLTYRAEFSSVKVPEDQLHTDGMNEIITGVKYQRIIDNNDDPPFDIDWNDHVIDPTELLALVQFNEEAFEQVGLEEDEKLHSETVQAVEESPSPESDNSLVIMLMVLATISGVTFLLFLKKK